MANDTLERLRCIWTTQMGRCPERAESRMVQKSRPWVCDRHEESIATFLANEQFREQRKELEAELDVLRREWQALQQILSRENSVVYYLQRDNGDIKIGVSRNINGRIATLEQDEGPLRLLAMEYGGATTEKIRHSQFRHLGTHGEWFRDDPELRDHCHRILVSSPAMVPQTAPATLPPA